MDDRIKTLEGDFNARGLRFGIVASRFNDFIVDRLLDALPATAVGERVGRIAVRCQTEFAPAYLRLVSRGYRVHWTDLRMTLESHPRRDPAQGVVMSNWEI